MQLTEAKLPGCYVLQFPAFQDQRGTFVKTMQHSIFSAHGLEGEFREVFYTVSGKGVLRGMHVQLPPHDHAKLVYSVSGAICDVVLDLRVGSPTYGKHEVHELSGPALNALYLPRGMAHGFYVREEPAVVVYHVTTEHNPVHDTGILWSSFGASWPTTDPVISLRDTRFAAFEDFESPFRYDAPQRDVPPRRYSQDGADGLAAGRLA